MNKEEYGARLQEQIQAYNKAVPIPRLDQRSPDPKKVLDFMEDCFEFQINLNDYFYYACSDSDTIEYYDLSRIWQLYEDYGFTALGAYFYVKQDLKDEYISIKERLTPEFRECVKKILEMKDKDVVFLDCLRHIPETK